MNVVIDGIIILCVSNKVLCNVQSYDFSNRKEAMPYDEVTDHNNNKSAIKRSDNLFVAFAFVAEFL